MAELWFYHLEKSPLERVLPGLLDKTLARGWRALVQARSQERVEALDTQLWTFGDESFLPHGTLKDSYPEQQPVLITTSEDNVNDADVLILVEGAHEAPLAATRLSSFERCIIVFDGKDDSALQAARAQWQASKDAGIDVSYWQEDANGRWVKKA
jgi:DNA polymerase-3 subunit chi